MKFFADTADVAEIRDLAEKGLLDGVTTNPSLVAKAGRNFIETVREICTIAEGPVSAEVASLDAETPAVLKQLVNHPLTDKGISLFLADWKKTGQSIL